MTYRKDDVLVPREGSAFTLTHKEVKLVERHEFRNQAVWWVENTNLSGQTAMGTLYETTLTAFVKKPTFFRMGHTYVFRGLGVVPANNATQHTVEEIYSVDNPDTPDDKLTAVLRARTSAGKEYITLAHKWEFAKMIDKDDVRDLV